MQGKVCVCVLREGGWAGVRQISLHPISLWHPWAHLLSPSILDDNSALICIPKTLSDMRLQSLCERLENIDNYWQNPKARAPLHLEYCIYHFILLFAPFLRLMRPRYWLVYLIAAAEVHMSRVGDIYSVDLDGMVCCCCLFVRISQWHRL